MLRGLSFCWVIIMISLVLNQDAFKILTVFSLSPGSSFRRKELKELTRLNNVPLDKALLRLSNSDVLRKKGTYFINMENQYAEAIIELCSKQHTQLKRIPLKVYFLITDFAFQASLFKGIELYLFGSYSKLVFSEKSDIDIAVLTLQNAKPIKGLLLALAEKLGKSYGKEVQLHFFDKKSFYSNKKDPLVSEIIRNGVHLI